MLEPISAYFMMIMMLNVDHDALIPISAYFMMNMMLNVDHDALTCREQGCIVDLIYLILDQI